MTKHRPPLHPYLIRPQRRPKADRELGHVYALQPRSQEVAALVHSHNCCQDPQGLQGGGRPVHAETRAWPGGRARVMVQAGEEEGSGEAHDWG